MPDFIGLFPTHDPKGSLVFAHWFQSWFHFRVWTEYQRAAVTGRHALTFVDATEIASKLHRTVQQRWEKSGDELFP
jgi:hypothetical protein